MHPSVDSWLALLETRHPTSIELGLKRIQKVANLMGIDPGTAQVITVAGTNGKGSTCAMIDALLSTHGLRTGRYASPHLLKFHERISLLGQPVSDALLLEAFSAIESARQDISLTFFEFTTLAAFWCFQQSNLDVWVVEVGLGGRLDATNILDADVGVVTSIALDHQDWLGSDLTQIGREKAGILRKDRPAVMGQIEDCEGVLETALALNCVIFQRGQQYQGSQKGPVWDWAGETLGLTGRMQQLAFMDLPVPALPLVNAATAIQAVCLLVPTITQKTISDALSSVSLQGRLQRFEWQAHECIVDVAHNPQAAHFIVSALAAKPWRPEAIVLGMLADKDVRHTVAALMELAPKALYVASLSVPRGQTAAHIAALIDTAVPIIECDSVEKAMNLAGQSHKKLLICGSFYTVAQAINHMQEVD